MNAKQFVRYVPIANHALTPPDVLAVLDRITRSIAPELIVEVGTFLGMGTTRLFGRAVGPTGNVVAVDNCCVDMAVRKGIHRPESHLHLLMSNLAQDPDLARVTLLRATSREAAGLFSGPADLIFIDAGHSATEVRTDIDAWLPHVRPGGILCGDDYTMPGVKEAVDERFPTAAVEGRIWHTVK